MARLLQATKPPRANPVSTLSLLIFICPLLVCLFRRRIQSATRLYITLGKTKLLHFGYSQSWGVGASPALFSNLCWRKRGLTQGLSPRHLWKQPSYAFGLLHPFHAKAQGSQ